MIIRFIRNQQSNTFKISNFSVDGNFIKDDGTILPLYKNLRSFVTPNWENNFSNTLKSEQNNKSKSHDFDLQLGISEYTYFFERFKRIAHTLNFTLDDKKALEIGSGNALLSYLMKQNFEKLEVESSDIKSYYDDLDKEDEIEKARNIVAKNFSFQIPFVYDDITQSNLESNAYDLIFSNTVLEHISDLDRAFKEMYRILKPGGICYHVYNPFFSYNGGHTICSTEHPWGHCMLTDVEYDRYLDERYPYYKEVSLSFFKNDLNKKSIAEFRQSINKANFKRVTFLNETNMNLLQLILSDTLKNIQKHYPIADLEDLLTNSITLVLVK